LKNHNSYISVFFSLLISIGLFLSLIHNHGHIDHSDDHLVHQITQDITECTICASHFKFSSDTDIDSHVLRSPEQSIYTFTAIDFVDPLNNLQEGRAPPSKG